MKANAISTKVQSKLRKIVEADRFEWVKTDLWYGKGRDAIVPKLFSKLLVSAVCDAIWFISIFAFFSLYDYLKSNESVDRVDSSVTTLTVSQCEVVLLFGTEIVPSWIILDRRASATRGVLQTIGQHLFTADATGTHATLDGTWFSGCQSILAIPDGVNMTILLEDSTVVINEQLLNNTRITFRSDNGFSSKLLITNTTMQQSQLQAYLSSGIIVAENITSSDATTPATLNLFVDFGAVVVQPSSPNFVVSAMLSANFSCISQPYFTSVSTQLVNGSAAYNYTVSGSATRVTGALQYQIRSTSLYVTDWNCSNRVASKALLTTPQSMSPLAEYEIATSADWAASFSFPDYVQTIEATMFGQNIVLVNSRRLVMLEYGSTLAYLTGFVLVPNYRRITSPLSHYQCPTVHSFAYSDLTETTAAFAPPANIETIAVLYGIVQNGTSNSSNLAFTKIVFENDTQVPKVIQSSPDGKVLLNPDTRKTMGKTNLCTWSKLWRCH